VAKRDEEKNMKLLFIKGFLAAALLVLFSGPAVKPTLAAEGYRIIGTDELRTWLQSAAPPTVIYSLSQVEFEEQRIPGSICIPMELMVESTDLPTRKDQPIVFYCKGPG
jgi:hypothetical protein